MTWYYQYYVVGGNKKKVVWILCHACLNSMRVFIVRVPKVFFHFPRGCPSSAVYFNMSIGFLPHTRRCSIGNIHLKKFKASNLEGACGWDIKSPEGLATFHWCICIHPIRGLPGVHNVHKRSWAATAGLVHCPQVVDQLSAKFAYSHLKRWRRYIFVDNVHLYSLCLMELFQCRFGAVVNPRSWFRNCQW